MAGKAKLSQAPVDCDGDRFRLGPKQTLVARALLLKERGARGGRGEADTQGEPGPRQVARHTATQPGTSLRQAPHAAEDTAVPTGGGVFARGAKATTESHRLSPPPAAHTPALSAHDQG